MTTKTTKQTIQDFIKEPTLKNFQNISQDHLAINLLPVNTLNMTFYTRFGQLIHTVEYLQGEKKTLFLKRAYELATLEEEYLKLYYHDDDNVLDEDLIEKLKELGNTSEDWKRRIEEVKMYGERVKEMLTMMLYESFVTYEDYTREIDTFFKYYDISEQMKYDFICKMYEIGSSLEHRLDTFTWIIDLKDLLYEDLLCEKRSIQYYERIIFNCFEDILSLAKTFDDWSMVYEQLLNYSDDNLVKVLIGTSLEKMKLEIL